MATRSSLRRFWLPIAGVALALVATTAPAVADPRGPEVPSAVGGTADGPPAPSGLRVSSLRGPMDLDQPPRFGWQVNTARQTAYEIAVSPHGSPARDGLTWSARVESSAQNDIRYSGPTLDPAQRYVWTVRTWDAGGRVSAWAPPAEFGTGPGATWSDSTAIWGSGGDTWTDYDLTGTFTIIENAATIVYRASSVENNYFWQFRADTNTFRPHRSQTGQAPALIHDQEIDLGELGITLEQGRPYDFRVEGRGSRITVTLGDTEVYERTDFGLYFGGGFGFRTGRFEQASFDDIRVTDPAGTVLYENDFSGENLDFPTMEHRDGVLFVTNSRNEVFAGTWANYTVRTRMTVTQAALGIRFRSTDASNGYFWQFRGDTNRLVPHRQAGGASVIATVNLPAGTLAVGKTVDVRIEVVGARIRTWIDDLLVDDRTHGEFGRGGVGVRNGNSEAGTLEDLSVVDTRGTVLVQTAFAADEPLTIPCGSVGGGVLTVPNAANCVNTGMLSDWAFVRKDFTLEDKPVAWAAVYATGADARPSKQHVYKLYVNGEYALMGPTRPMADENRYDGLDVTRLLRPGAPNTLGATLYSTADRRFQAELHVAYADGTRQVVGTDRSWRALNGDATFPAVGSIGTSYYQAPRENLDARTFPEGFAEPGYDDGAWRPAAVKAALPNLQAAPMDKVRERTYEPVRIVEKAPGHYFVDFGRSFVGGLRYDVAAGRVGETIDVRFGEVPVAGDPLTVRYQLSAGNTYRDVYTQRAGRQRFETFGMRVFRYVEIIGAPEEVTAENLQALALIYPFDREAATFTSSNDNLNQVWDLSRNTIEALNVNFYVDTWTRERINYEADAYLQQMSSLYLMEDLSLARYSMDYFKTNRTWPTEWPIYVILAVHDAWRQTGETTQVSEYYANLQTKLPDQWFEAETGLIRKTSRSNGCNSQTDCDIVDWPASQRDGYEFRQYNTVLNALSYRAYRDMAAMATQLGEDEDADRYAERADTIRAAMNTYLYDETAGRYVDGMGADRVRTANASIHASAFSAAFGIPTAEEAPRVASYVASKGMACSVYCAPFVLNGLYDGDNGDAPLDLLTSEGLWSWMNMIKVGAGATMESWDLSLKPNVTYSHPWGAGPAFVVPSGLFGIQPTTPGYGTFRVKPQPSTLDHAAVTVPTVRGRIDAGFTRGADDRLRLAVEVPGNTTADLVVPVPDGTTRVWVNGRPRQVDERGGFAAVPAVGIGCTIVTSESATAGRDDERLLGACDGAPDWYDGPTVEITVVGEGSGEWYRDARVELAGEVGSALSFRIGGDEEWTTYADPIELPEGITSVEARAELDGQVGPVRRATVRVDDTPPVVAAELTSERRLVLSADDALSGVDGVEWALGEGAWRPYDGPVAIGPEAVIARYRARDLAGNLSETGLLEVEGAPDAPDRVGSSVSADVVGQTPVRFGKGARVRIAVSGDGEALATGEVVVRRGSRVLAAGTLRNGRVVVSLPARMAVRRHVLAVEYGGDGTYAPSSTSLQVQVAKAVSRVGLRLVPASVARGNRARAVIDVRAFGSRVARGRVQVRVDGRVVRRVRLSPLGPVRVVLPRRVPGRYRVVARFVGKPNLAASTGSAVLRVRR